MADYKVFYGSSLTPSGSTIITGNSLVLWATPSYSEDFEGYSVGQSGLNWVSLGLSTGTVAYNGSQNVYRVQCPNGNNGVYYTGSVFGDGCFEIQVTSAAGRVVQIPRFSNIANKGYGTQWGNGFNNFYRAWSSAGALGVGSVYVLQDGSDCPTFPPVGNKIIKVHTKTNTNGSVYYGQEFITDISGIRKVQFTDSNLKHAPGYLYLAGLNGTNDFGYVKFWPVLSGGFTTSWTPNFITNLNSISVDWDSTGMTSHSLSGVFEYQIDNGSWLPLALDGNINSACSGTIGFRAINTIKNDWDASANVSINSISVSIDGRWQPEPIPVAFLISI